jgi:hypothetical protein
MRLIPSILLAVLVCAEKAVPSKQGSVTWHGRYSYDRTLLIDRRRLPADNATDVAGENAPAPKPPTGVDEDLPPKPENLTGEDKSPKTEGVPPPQAQDPPATEDSPTQGSTPGYEESPPVAPGGSAPEDAPPVSSPVGEQPKPEGGELPTNESSNESPPPPLNGEEEPPAPEGEDEAPPKVPKGSPGPSSTSSTSGPSSSKSKKATGKGASKGDEEDPDAGTAETISGCESLQGSAVKGQVQYTVEVVAATEKDAAAVADDVNDLVVSSLTKSLVKNGCKRRQRRFRDQRRHLQRQHRRRTADIQFLSISNGGSKASGPCPGGKATCFRVVSNVNFEVVEGEGSGGADQQVIDALPPTFATLSSDQVRFIEAGSGEEDRTSVAAAEGSSSEKSLAKPGVSSTTIAIAFGALIASVIAAVLYVRVQRRRKSRFIADLDKVEKELNVTGTTADDSNLVYVYDDESEGYESDYQLTSRERRFLSKLRLPRRKKRSKNAANVVLQVDATYMDDDQSVEVIERTTMKVPPVPRTYSGTVITPPPRVKSSRPAWFANTVDF